MADILNVANLPVLFDERSDNERQVGWYVNSSGLKKPIYETTVFTNSLAQFNHNIANIDMITWVCGGNYLSYTIYPIPFVGGSSWIQVFVNRTKVDLTSSGDWSVGTIFIHIQYTKTTDQFE